MIYTLTLNPAVDYVLHLDKLTPGSIGRSHNESVFCGGKGINVSLILQEHGIPSVAMGFIAGFTGTAIEEGLREKNLQTDFVRLHNGFSRINIKIRAHEETDINGEGPQIGNDDLNALFTKLDNIQSGDTLVLAGSIPSSLPRDIYKTIMDTLSDREIRFVVDATGELLMSALAYRPFLIKPNNEELGEIFSTEISSPDQAIVYAAKLQEKGARNVLVSMGGKGAVLLDEKGQKHYMPAYRGEVVNTVGAGDSMVAGFLAGYEQTKSFAYALKLGSASGSATAFCEGLADIEQIKNVLNNQ